MASRNVLSSSVKQDRKPPSEQGFFQKGKWLCNCTPRLPAIQFQVKREGKNKGRWFWTCQTDRTKGKTGDPEKCDFFLWGEDAQVREQSAVLGNSRTEPQTPRKKLKQTILSATITPRTDGPRSIDFRTPITPLSELPGAHIRAEASMGSSATLGRSGKSDATARLDDDGLFGSDFSSGEEDALAQIVDATSSQQIAKAGTKRKRAAADDGDFGGFSSDEERQLVAITDSSSQSQGCQKKFDAFATPAAPRTTDVFTGRPTPSFTDKPVNRRIFADLEAPSTAKRQRNGVSLTLFSSQDGVVATPGTSMASLTADVMGLLKDKSIDEETLFKVKNLLMKFEIKARGLEKGRDASRQAVNGEKERNAELMQKIADLENKRKMDADARKKMRTEMMRLYSEY